MSNPNEGKNSLWIRESQKKDWLDSETNKEPTYLRNKDNTKVKFHKNCVFLAACSGGDTEEIERQLKNGSEIDTANIDGLTALHQACIDDDLEMVKYLVDHGASIERTDAEGWSPLHAAAFSGKLEIIKYLLQKGADPLHVNNDTQIPIDILDEEYAECIDLFNKYIEETGRNPSDARSEEETLMQNDVNEWLRLGENREVIQPSSKATALHVAASKGYLQVMKTLFELGVDIDAQDNDGWSPLHAAAHWGEKEACQLLVIRGCDMTVKTKEGWTAIDVCCKENLTMLKDLRKKQANMNKELPKLAPTINKNRIITRRSSVTRMNIDDKQRITHANLIDEAIDRPSSLIDLPIEEDGTTTDDASSEARNDTILTNGATSGESSSNNSSESESEKESNHVSEKDSTPTNDASPINETTPTNDTTPTKDTTNIEENTPTLHDVKSSHESLSTPTSDVPPVPTSSPPHEEDDKARTTHQHSKLTSQPRFDFSSNKGSKEDVSTTKDEVEEDQGIVTKQTSLLRRQPTVEITQPRQHSIEDTSVATATRNSMRKRMMYQSDSTTSTTSTPSITSVAPMNDSTENDNDTTNNQRKDMMPSSTSSSFSKTSGSNLLGRRWTAPRVDTPIKPVRPNTIPLTRTSSASGHRASLDIHSSANSSPSLTSDPSSWRNGLKKADSSSAVPEKVSRLDTMSRSEDNTVAKEASRIGSMVEALSRSASSGWVNDHSGKVQFRRQHTSNTDNNSTESQDTRNRFNDLYLEHANLCYTPYSPTRSSVTTTTSGTPTIQPSKSIDLPTSLQVTRQQKQEQRDRDKQERQRMLGLPTVSSVETTTSTNSGISSSAKYDGISNRYNSIRGDHEEKEIERKTKARKARISRRSTQGVTKDDVARASIALSAASKGVDLQLIKAAADKKEEQRMANMDQTDSLPSMNNNTKEINGDKPQVKSQFLSRYMIETEARERAKAAAAAASIITTSTTSTIPVASSTIATHTDTTDTGSTTTLYERNRSRDSRISKDNETNVSSTYGRARRKRETRRSTGFVTSEDLAQASQPLNTKNNSSSVTSIRPPTSPLNSPTSKTDEHKVFEY